MTDAAQRRRRERALANQCCDLLEHLATETLEIIAGCSFAVLLLRRRRDGTVRPLGERLPLETRLAVHVLSRARRQRRRGNGG